MAKATYKSAGVDLEQYRDAMQRLPALLHRTYSPRVIRSDGGFAGLFRLDFASRLFARQYRDPVLVSCTDGVGTKLKLANLTGIHHTVGIDLVAMSVNDLICTGAEPLFFLDYIAMSHDDPPLLEDVVRGISQGCIEADCALLGGETAIMPDLYARGDYDLAGFCVGVVERDHLIDGSAIAPGDVLLGVASSGLHSNGFSLARKIVFDIANLQVGDMIEPLQTTVGDALLHPTRIYVSQLRKVLGHYKVKNVVHGIAHITGGGLLENVGRILPKNVDALFARGSWEIPPVFPWLQQLGEVDEDEMFSVFNMGVGLVLVVSHFYASNIQQMFNDRGYATTVIGTVTEGTGESRWQ
ncbi:MAG: phosphoribosylformylglycinamidine cyclo-ligase [Pirellulaceae bacterium]|nr:phosphoribosylformylglycinamidine cyclo-ligase [Planctomycetales bacterium]